MKLPRVGAKVRTTMLDEIGQVRGVPIHYTSQGAGEPVILVHGIGASLYDWARLTPSL